MREAEYLRGHALRQRRLCLARDRHGFSHDHGTERRPLDGGLCQIGGGAGPRRVEGPCMIHWLSLCNREEQKMQNRAIGRRQLLVAGAATLAAPAVAQPAKTATLRFVPQAN